MTLKTIIEQLQLKHRDFTRTIEKLTEEEFKYSLNGDKWTAGQQLDHIYRSLKPLNKGLRLPKWMLKMVFKKANRPSRSFDGLVSKYEIKLRDGGKASGQFIPPKISFDRREEIISKIHQTVDQMCVSLEKYSEHELDTLVLPHPLLGHITLREMMYFTIHHADQHRQIVLRNSKNPTSEGHGNIDVSINLS